MARFSSPSSLSSLHGLRSFGGLLFASTFTLLACSSSSSTTPSGPATADGGGGGGGAAKLTRADAAREYGAPMMCKMLEGCMENFDESFPEGIEQCTTGFLKELSEGDQTAESPCTREQWQTCVNAFEAAECPEDVSAPEPPEACKACDS
jgi:hypothetical protein